MKVDEYKRDDKGREDDIGKQEQAQPIFKKKDQVEQSHEQFDRRVDRGYADAAASTPAAERDIAEDGDVFIGMYACIARGTVRAGEDNRLTERQPVYDYVQETPDYQAEDKDRNADDNGRKVVHFRLSTGPIQLSP
jgi:hypothetical protein